MVVTGKPQRKNSGLDYNSSIRFPVSVLKRLCSLCSETKEEDRPGRERGSKRGVEGDFGHLPVMHFRQAMCFTCRLLTHRILQAPFSLYQQRHCRKAHCLPHPQNPEWHHTDVQTHTQGKQVDYMASLLCYWEMYLSVSLEGSTRLSNTVHTYIYSSPHCVKQHLCMFLQMTALFQLCKM